MEVGNPTNIMKEIISLAIFLQIHYYPAPIFEPWGTEKIHRIEVALYRLSQHQD